MKRVKLKLELVTPAFLAGADQSKAEWRAASVRRCTVAKGDSEGLWRAGASSAPGEVVEGDRSLRVPHHHLDGQRMVASIALGEVVPQPAKPDDPFLRPLSRYETGQLYLPITRKGYRPACRKR